MEESKHVFGVVSRVLNVDGESSRQTSNQRIILRHKDTKTNSKQTDEIKSEYTIMAAERIW